MTLRQHARMIGEILYTALFLLNCVALVYWTIRLGRYGDPDDAYRAAVSFAAALIMRVGR